MLQKEIKDRLSLDEIIKHPYITKEGKSSLNVDGYDENDLEDSSSYDNSNFP